MISYLKLGQEIDKFYSIQMCIYQRKISTNVAKIVKFVKNWK